MDSLFQPEDEAYTFTAGTLDRRARVAIEELFGDFRQFKTRDVAAIILSALQEVELSVRAKKRAALSQSEGS